MPIATSGYHALTDGSAFVKFWWLIFCHKLEFDEYLLNAWELQ